MITNHHYTCECGGTLVVSIEGLYRCNRCGKQDHTKKCVNCGRKNKGIMCLNIKTKVCDIWIKG